MTFAATSAKLTADLDEKLTSIETDADQTERAFEEQRIRLDEDIRDVPGILAETARLVADRRDILPPLSVRRGLWWRISRMIRRSA